MFTHNYSGLSIRLNGTSPATSPPPRPPLPVLLQVCSREEVTRVRERLIAEWQEQKLSEEAIASLLDQEKMAARLDQLEKKISRRQADAQVEVEDLEVSWRACCAALCCAALCCAVLCHALCCCWCGCTNQLQLIRSVCTACLAMPVCTACLPVLPACTACRSRCTAWS